MPYLYFLEAAVTTYTPKFSGDGTAASYPSFITTVFTNIANTVKAIGSYAIVIIGIALIIMAVVLIAKGFVTVMKGGWAIAIGTLLFGGVLSFGGWGFITSNKYGTIGKATLDKIITDGKNTTSTIGEIAEGTSTTAVDNASQAVSLISDSFLTPFAQAVAVCVGIALVVFAAAKIAMFFIKGGKTQTSWGWIAATAIVGSILFTATPTDNSAGWAWLRDTMTSAVRDTVNNAVDGDSTQTASGLDLSESGMTYTTTTSSDTEKDEPPLPQ